MRNPVRPDGRYRRPARREKTVGCPQAQPPYPTHCRMKEWQVTDFRSVQPNIRYVGGF